MFTIFFTNKSVENFSDAKTSDTIKFGKFFHGMLKKGIYLPPSQYESWFLSTQITDEHIQYLVHSADEVLTTI
jgi:glutamate-1-semialdehyde 2,1-aminomutase